MKYCTFFPEFPTPPEEDDGLQPCRFINLLAFQNYSEKGDFSFTFFLFEACFPEQSCSPSPDILGFLRCKDLKDKVRMKTQTCLCRQSRLHSPQHPATQQCERTKECRADSGLSFLETPEPGGQDFPRLRNQFSG